MMKARTNKSDVYTYARPSVNALVVQHHKAVSYTHLTLPTMAVV